jgi:hypothetical protein
MDRLIKELEKILKTRNKWENRRLCSDESCIGVIDQDDHCKECGKPFSEN